MEPLKTTGRGGELVEVGYSAEWGGYHFAMFEGNDTRPCFQTEPDDCPTILQLIAITSGEVDWSEHGEVIRALVAIAEPGQARATRILADALC
ncbi:hypothetical protein [Blastococcus sp. VKM Ac-2987]|uniref:hypothetical protein n=1 Tax=Blastococcus sp. VKM Ac-2987 TaxID=3004141 RepID=UPI0022AB51AE|nr:hypothetical protein [Blastococcus sp. VKM Ac-2987]MCZ2857444.1 hypothetical protein [Blastococcus sp. VKM Ac-2987]